MVFVPIKSALDRKVRSLSKNCALLLSSHDYVFLRLIQEMEPLNSSFQNFDDLAQDTDGGAFLEAYSNRLVFS